jgi:phosphoserine phosphatase RsbU/P
MKNEIEFSQNLFKNYLASTNEYIFFKDLDGIYRAVSESTAELAGLSSSAEMVGKYDYEIYPAKSAQAFMIQDKKVIDTKKPVVDSDWIEHAKLGKMLIETVKSPLFDTHGNLIGIEGISRDITDRFLVNKELKGKSALFKTILDCVPIPIWVKDKENRYVIVNDYYKKFYGISDDQLSGNNIATVLQSNKLYDAENLEILRKQDEYVLNSKKASSVEVKTNINGQNRLVKILKTPVLTEDGAGIGFVGFSQDITNKR